MVLSDEPAIIYPESNNLTDQGKRSHRVIYAVIASANAVTDLIVWASRFGPLTVIDNFFNRDGITVFRNINQPSALETDRS